MSNAKLTLQEYINKAWKRISRDPDSNFADNDELTQIINEARREAWDNLLDIDENFGIATPFTITIVEGTTLYDVPSNFRSVLGVRVEDDSVNIPLTLNKRIAERSDSNNGVAPLGSYAMVGDQLKVTASANGTVIMDYMQDIDYYEYVPEVKDVNDNITTFGITTP